MGMNYNQNAQSNYIRCRACLKQSDRVSQVERKRDREEERETETERDRDRQTETERERQTERETERDRERERERETDRQKERDRQRGIQGDRGTKLKTTTKQNINLLLIQIKKQTNKWNPSTEYPKYFSYNVRTCFRGVCDNDAC